MDLNITTTIIANNISVKNNLLPSADYTLVPTYKRKTGFLDDNKYFTELTVEIKNTEENPFPFDVTATMTAIFTIEGLDKKDIDRFLRINGVQTLLPYVRAAISSVSASAMTTPIILPIVNVLRLFPEDQEIIANSQK